MFCVCFDLVTLSELCYRELCVVICYAETNRAFACILCRQPADKTNMCEQCQQQLNGGLWFFNVCLYDCHTCNYTHSILNTFLLTHPVNLFCVYVLERYTNNNNSTCGDNVGGRRAGCHVGRYALNGTVENHNFTTGPSDVDIDEYLHSDADDIRQQLNTAVERHTSIKHYATMDVQFYRTTVDGELQHTTARFRTSPNILSDATAIDIDGMVKEFTSAVENFNNRGSN